MATIAELMKALPEATDTQTGLNELSAPLQAASLRPVPMGRLRRVGLLGTLQAKIAAAYFFYWLRGWFVGAESRQKQLAETHWRTALRLMDSMGYLRGGVMKVGQMLGNFPDIAPKEIAETVERLCYAAPPMHYSLLREMVRNELGQDPERIFSSFDQNAFAAASLGQVHGARLASGEAVAVKIQYPGIARTVAEDFKNLNLFLLAGRLQPDWENIKSQFEDLQQRLAEETDYRQEAATQAIAVSLFRPEEGILVPRIFPEFSTERVLTMERLGGVHLDRYLQSEPSQEQRNEAARKILRAFYRMLGKGHLFYADFHPGNFLFQPDGRVGVIDFGFVLRLEDEDWALSNRMERALSSGRDEDLAAAVKEWSWISDSPAETERVRLSVEFTKWVWGWRHHEGLFDFGDEADFRRGVSLWLQLARKRYCRARPCTPALARMQFGYRALLYRLKARIDARNIVEEELDLRA